MLEDENSRSLFCCSKAMVGYPVYLVVVLITAGIILGSFAMSSLLVKNSSSVDLTRMEVNKIISEAEHMYEYGDGGSKVVLEMDLPEEVCFVVFGSMPVDGNQKPGCFDLNVDTCNCYYFVMEDGTRRQGVSSARFAGGDLDSFAYFEGGRHDITMQLVYKPGEGSFVKIYE
ncbi:MAG: hypothetical protein V5A64_03405 [Candidatus Thermoplasmatota archaeon]